jgi:DNA-binding NarL/FixJ family response regulator
MCIRILIADDHSLFREGLSNLFTDESIEIVGMAESGGDAIEKSRILKPDIILMDIGMKGMNGIDATKIICRETPEIRIIGLTMHSDINYIREILDSGASGYILKSCSYAELLEAIFAVHKGNTYLSEEITNIVVNDYLMKGKPQNNYKLNLSERETEVFEFFVKGFSTREIANKLFVSVKTIGSHKQHILKKLDLKSNSDLIKYGLKNGLISKD